VHRLVFDERQDEQVGAALFGGVDGGIERHHHMQESII
jgi:hypothetical protein